MSRLSPDLRFGDIGPRAIAHTVRAADMPANANWTYLDELLTWREYFDYLACHDEAPDAFQTVPEKLRNALLDHAADERPVLYSLVDLVHGRAEDETWNSAQRQRF